jgi:hypothetical protein
MTALAIVGLIYQATRKPRWLLSWDGLLLMVIYAGSMYMVLPCSIIMPCGACIHMRSKAGSYERL